MSHPTRLSSSRLPSATSGASLLNAARIQKLPRPNRGDPYAIPDSPDKQAAPVHSVKGKGKSPQDTGYVARDAVEADEVNVDESVVDLIESPCEEPKVVPLDGEEDAGESIAPGLGEKSDSAKVEGCVPEKQSVVTSAGSFLEESEGHAEATPTSILKKQKGKGRRSVSQSAPAGSAESNIQGSASKTRKARQQLKRTSVASVSEPAEEETDPIVQPSPAKKRGTTTQQSNVESESAEEEPEPTVQPSPAEKRRTSNQRSTITSEPAEEQFEQLAQPSPAKKRRISTQQPAVESEPTDKPEPTVQSSPAKKRGTSTQRPIIKSEPTNDTQRISKRVTTHSALSTPKVLANDHAKNGGKAREVKTARFEPAEEVEEAGQGSKEEQKDVEMGGEYSKSNGRNSVGIGPNAAGRQLNVEGGAQDVETDGQDFGTGGQVAEEKSEKEEKYDGAHEESEEGQDRQSSEGEEQEDVQGHEVWQILNTESRQGKCMTTLGAKLRRQIRDVRHVVDTDEAADDMHDLIHKLEDSMRCTPQSVPVDDRSAFRCDAYAYIFRHLALLLYSLNTAFGGDNSTLAESHDAMDTMISFLGSVRDFYEAITEWKVKIPKRFQGDVLIKDTERKFIVPAHSLLKVYRAKRRSSEEHSRRAAAQQQRQNQLAHQKQAREQEAALTERRERWRRLYESRLRYVAQCKEQYPGSKWHFKFHFREPTMRCIDANGNEIDPAPVDREWSEVEEGALRSALQKYPGPTVFENVFKKHCGRNGVLRDFTVSEITAKAAAIRAAWIMASQRTGHEVPEWASKIPVLP